MGSHVIKFPNNGEVKGEYGPYQISSEGRNGYMKQVGLDILVYNGKAILQPINSRNAVGRCTIEIPTDPDTIKAICKALMESIETPK